MSISNALFNPASIALVGASADPKKNAGRPQRFLIQHGYKGKIYPVNPFRDEVQGIKAYRSLREIPGQVDHAFLMTPADTIADLIIECGECGVKVVSIYSDGFAESGPEGEKRQRKLVDLANTKGIRVIGPNSMGVISVNNGMTLSVNAVLEMPKLVPGRISVASQSGTVLGTLLSRGAARGIGFSKLVSVGNECDLGIGEVARLLVDDPDTDSILLFLEGIRNPEVLADAARRAHEMRKPIIVYKLGKSEAGRRLAVSHSGALASSARTTDAFFTKHGILRVDMLESLLEISPLVADRSPAPGKRVSVVTTTGGGAAMVADRLGQNGLELIGPSDALRDRLRRLDVEIGSGPLVDLTMAGTRKGVYGAALQELFKDDRCDAVVCVVGSSGQFHPELAVSPIIDAGKTDKFLAAFIAPEAEQSLERLNQAGIAAFRTPEACADALSAALRWSKPQEVSLAKTPEFALKNSYNEQEALQLIRSLGIPTVTSSEIRADETLEPDIIYPLVVKILDDQIAHKSELGGVIVGVPDAEGLVTAIKTIQHSVTAHLPESTCDRFLLQTMETGILEVLLGYKRDPEVGPIIILGSGGVLTEVLDDVAIGIAPLGLPEAYDLISKVKGLTVLTGFRGRPKGDIAALAEAIVNLSQLAAHSAEQIEEAEINPLLVKGEGQGVLALDGLVRVKE